MNKHDRPAQSSPNSGRVVAGVIIIGIGIILLAGQMGLGWLFPPWIFNWGNLWPMILIVIGLISGGNSNFRHPSSYILIGIGSFFLLKNLTDLNIGPFIWPALIIGIGLWLLLGREQSCPPRPGSHRHHKGDDAGTYEWDKRVVDEQPASESENTTGFSNEDYLKATSVFGGAKKIIISKNFRGGEIINIFGGTDVNLIQADIRQPIVIDVFQIFAGTKIIVPSHWKIHSDVVSVFGEVDDKRFTQGIPHDEQKIVYIKGTSLFGGITIKSI